jgi:hypothetical protein
VSLPLSIASNGTLKDPIQVPVEPGGATAQGAGGPGGPPMGMPPGMGMPRGMGGPPAGMSGPPAGMGGPPAGMSGPPAGMGAPPPSAPR